MRFVLFEEFILVFFLFCLLRWLILFILLLSLLEWELGDWEVFEVCFWCSRFWDDVNVFFVLWFEVWLNEKDCLKFIFVWVVMILVEVCLRFFIWLNVIFLLGWWCGLCLLDRVIVGILILVNFFFGLVWIIIRFIVDG